MAVGHEWMVRNLGIDAPAVAGLMSEAAVSDDVALVRELIDFDSERADAQALLAAAPKGPPTLAHVVAIPWPAGLAPTPAQSVADGESLPPADVLVVTWTTDEGHALSRS